jgi:hypothetical protein
MKRGVGNLRRESKEAQDACLEFYLDCLFVLLYKKYHLNIYAKLIC